MSDIFKSAFLKDLFGFLVAEFCTYDNIVTANAFLPRLGNVSAILVIFL